MKPMPDPQQSLLALRVPAVARALGCSEANVRRMIYKGQIPARRLGGRVIVLVAEFHAYLQSLAPAAKSRC
jgi:excisionase family DNA binding protein